MLTNNIKIRVKLFTNIQANDVDYSIEEEGKLYIFM